MSKFNHVTTAVVGIGDMKPSQLLRHSGNFYGKKMLSTLAEKGAIGDICLHYYNANGEPVLSSDEDPAIGMRLEQIKACPHAVALAGGREKVAAIRAALTGQYLNVLITDFDTARALVDD